MREITQMTEEQANDLYGAAQASKEFFILYLKQRGFIKKTAIEEAEEMYDEYKKIFNPSVKTYVCVLIEKQHEAIQELKEKKP